MSVPESKCRQQNKNEVHCQLEGTHIKEFNYESCVPALAPAPASAPALLLLFLLLLLLKREKREEKTEREEKIERDVRSLS